MDNKKIISLKQELLTLEQTVIENSKKAATKSSHLTFGIGLLIGFLFFVFNDGLKDKFMLEWVFVFGITGLTFLLLGVLKNTGIVNKLKSSKERVYAIKYELIELEYQ